MTIILITSPPPDSVYQMCTHVLKLKHNLIVLHMCLEFDYHIKLCDYIFIYTIIMNNTRKLMIYK